MLRNASKKKIKRKVKLWNNFWQKGEIDYTIAIPSLQSWFGHASHCNSYHIKQKILNKSQFLYLENKDYFPVLSDIGYDENLKSEFLDDDDFKKLLFDMETFPIK